MSSLYRKWFVRWSDVQLFFPKHIASIKLVCWNYMPGHAEDVGGRNFSARLTGVEAGLPDTYGRSADESIELMNEWLLRHAVQSEEQSSPSDLS